MHGSARDVWAEVQQWEAMPETPEPLVIGTSGSTGEPKRVKLSRAAMRASAAATLNRLGGPGQWLVALDPSHIAGAQVLFRSAVAGVEPAFLDEHADLPAAVRAMSGSPRFVSLVPTQLARLLSAEPDTDALRAFDTILLGGAAVDPGLREIAEREGLRIVATYGMSETCGGCVYEGVTLDGVAVAVAADGRVRLSGPVLFDGYDGQPELTAQVLQDGWFLTSDFGRLDEDGRLQVLGRVDDVVISGGVNVPTAVVAARVREHADVRSAEVVGAHDPEWGQRVVAVVVTRKALDPSEIRSFVSERLPREWAPMQVVVVDEIPLLGNGKVDRLRLGELAEAGTTVEDLR